MWMSALSVSYSHHYRLHIASIHSKSYANSHQLVGILKSESVEIHQTILRNINTLETLTNDS